MKYMVYLLLVLALSGCYFGKPWGPNERQKTTYELRNKAARKISKKTGLIFSGTIGGSVSHEIRMLYLGFECRKPMDVAKAREFLVLAIQDFAAEINSDERMRPFLTVYPFEPKNIRISIFLIDRNGKDFGEGTLCAASARDGVLTYTNHGPNKQYPTIHAETYEEALQIVQDSLAKEQAM